MAHPLHFRQLGGQWCAWDTRRLVAAARDLQVEQVSLGQITELDEPYWPERPGAHLTARAIAEHAAQIAAADLAQPILLCPEGRLLDGIHRVCRAWIDGVPSLPARRFRFLPPPDYRGSQLEDILARRS